MNRILEIAITQIGVTEDAAHTNKGGSIKYQQAAGLGNAGGFPWCQSLIVWCGLQAYGKDSPIPKVAGVLECLRLAREKGCKIIEGNNITVANIIPGCQFILKEGPTNGHTGIVESIDADGHLHTIEGNSNEDGSRDGYKVCRQSKRRISDKNIIAYIVYNYPDSK